MDGARQGTAAAAVAVGAVVPANARAGDSPQLFDSISTDEHDGAAGARRNQRTVRFAV